MHILLLISLIGAAPTGVYQQAITDFYTGDWERAKQGFSSETTGTNAGDALYNLAAIDYLQGKYTDVRDLLPQVIQAKGPYGINMLAGDSYLAERDAEGKPVKANISEAMDLFNRVSQTILSDHCKAAALYMQGSYGAAWDKVKDYIQNPGCPDSVLAIAGLIRHGMKKDDEAVSLLAAASKDEDAPTAVLVANARLLDELGRAAEANQLVARAATRPDVKGYVAILAPISDKTMQTDSGVQSKLARARLALWQQQPAVTLNALLQAGDADPEVLFLRGSASGVLSRYQEAIDDLQTALRHNPSPNLASRINAQLLVLYFRASNSQAIYDLLQKQALNLGSILPSPFPKPTLEDGLWYFDTLKPLEDWLTGIGNSSADNSMAALNLGVLLILEGKYADATKPLADGLNRIGNPKDDDTTKTYEMYRQIFNNISGKKAEGMPDLFSKGVSSGSHLIGINLFPPGLSKEMLYYLP